MYQDDRKRMFAAARLTVRAYAKGPLGQQRRTCPRRLEGRERYENPLILEAMAGSQTLKPNSNKAH